MANNSKLGPVFDPTTAIKPEQKAVIGDVFDPTAGGIDDKQEQDVSAPNKSYTLGEALVKGWQNFLPSLAGTVEDIGSAVVANPVGAVGELAKVANGVLEKAFPEFMQDPEQKQAANQAMEQVLGKWGLTEKTGYEDFKRNLAENPGPMALDLSVALEGGGSMLAQLPRMAKTGQSIATAGRMINPVNVAMETVKAPVRAIPQEATEAAGRKMVEKQMKPSTTLRPQDRIEILNYAASGGPEGLKNSKLSGIPVNPKGLKRVKDRIDFINKQFDDVIELAATKGETVSVEAVLKQVERTRKNISDNIYYDELVPHVDKAIEYLRNHRNVSGGRLPIERARAMKTEIYRTIDGAYGEISSVSDEVLKDVAHGINKQIYDVYPELKSLGQEQRVLLTLNRELERAVNRLGNNNAVSLQDIGTMGAMGAASAPAPVTVGATLMQRVLRVPTVRSILAKALAKANKVPFDKRLKGKLPNTFRNLYVTEQVQPDRENYVEQTSSTGE